MPRAQAPAPSGDTRADDYASLLRSLTGSFAWPRALIVSLILLALLPNLTVLALLWFPGARAFLWQPTPAVEAAVPPNLPMTDNIGLKPAPEPETTPVLSAPETLDAKAGEDTAFPLALDGTDAVPARSSVAISGLPQGARLSNGRPYGDSGWNLTADEIGDLHLVVAGSTAAATTVRIQLIAPDGKVLAGAETVLKVTPDAAAALPPAAASLEDAAQPAAIEANAAPPDLAAVAVVPAANAGPAAADSEAKPGKAAADQANADQGNADQASADQANAAPARSASIAPSTVGTPVAAEEDDGTWIEPSEFVNLRNGPSSSATVLGVVAEGTKLKVIGRKRRWVQVTNPATAETGWIYGRYVDGLPGGGGGATKRPRRKDSSDSDESMWTRFGKWLTGS